jgi:hypothetical protein
MFYIYISYKYEYVLIYLNMLRLFQEIKILFYFIFEIKLGFNKKNFSFKYLIQGFNPHLLKWFNVYSS